VLASVALAFAAAASAGVPLKVILFPGAQNMPMWVAEKNGYFANEGLKVELTATPGSVFMVQSLVKGDQDIALGAFDNVVAYDEGQGEVALADPQFVAFASITRGTVQVVAQPSIATISDLKGKSLAVDAVNTGYALALRQILRDRGLSESDYTFEPIGGTLQRFQALLANKTSATVLTTPFDLSAEAKGYRRLASLVDLVGPYQSTAAFARRSLIASRRDDLVRFARATSKAMDWIFDPAHRDEAAALYLANMKNAAEGEAKAAVASLVQEKEGFARAARLDPAGMATVLKIRSEFGKPRKDLSDPSRYVDESILRDALR